MSRTREVPAAARHEGQAWLPPRWFVVLFWHGHRVLLRATRGRLGLWRPKPGRWGALRLTTTGRRTGRPRQVIVGYFEDGGNLVTMAMNGWGAAEPAWWLNLQAHPDATVQTRDGARPVRARALLEDRAALRAQRGAEAVECAKAGLGCAPGFVEGEPRYGGFQSLVELLRRQRPVAERDQRRRVGDAVLGERIVLAQEAGLDVLRRCHHPRHEFLERRFR